MQDCNTYATCEVVDITQNLGFLGVPGLDLLEWVTEGITKIQGKTQWFLLTGGSHAPNSGET